MEIEDDVFGDMIRTETGWKCLSGAISLGLIGQIHFLVCALTI